MKSVYLIVPLFLFVLAAITILFFMSEHSFGARCTKAGYKAAEHEACVIRLSNGGTVYLENMK